MDGVFLCNRSIAPQCVWSKAGCLLLFTGEVMTGVLGPTINSPILLPKMDVSVTSIKKKIIFLEKVTDLRNRLP